eukprot:EG_transcript_17234
MSFLQWSVPWLCFPDGVVQGWGFCQRQVWKWWWVGSRKARGLLRRVFGGRLPFLRSAWRPRRVKPPADTLVRRQQKPQLFYAEKFNAPDEVTLHTIGVVHSPYKERFGTPRQATVFQHSLGNRPQQTEIHLKDDPKFRTALRGLEGFEYVWVITFMHLNNRQWSPLITPPRGPKVKQGVFATRAPHRPNPIALSALRLLHIDAAKGVLVFEGSDLIHGTPVLDIKPYVPYADAFPTARSGWLDHVGGDMAEPDRLPYWPPPRQCLGDVEDPAPPPAVSEVTAPPGETPDSPTATPNSDATSDGR